jgi:hypothetical protein
MVLKLIVAVHDADPLDTSTGGSGNEVNAHSLSKGKFDLGCVCGSNSSKLQFKNLGIENTLPNSTPWIQILENVY